MELGVALLLSSDQFEEVCHQKLQSDEENEDTADDCVCEDSGYGAMDEEALEDLWLCSPYPGDTCRSALVGILFGFALNL